MKDDLFRDSVAEDMDERRRKVGKHDYTCLDEVTTGVVTIDHLPGGHGQSSQRLPEPIEIIKTKVQDVGDDLTPPPVMPGRMLSSEEVERMVKSGKFSQSMVPPRERHCRECDTLLEQDRHIVCKKCMPKLPEDPGSTLYCGVSGE